MQLKLNPAMANLATILILTSGVASASGTHSGGHAAAAIGEPGLAAAATRTVAVDMADTMRFSPAKLTVKQGETVRFVLANSGRTKHEFVLGSAKDLKEHYEVMKKFPEMEHAEANMVTLAPGQTGEVVWKFTKAGNVDFACLQPGHYDAGMKGHVMVTKQAMVRDKKPMPKDVHEHRR